MSKFVDTILEQYETLGGSRTWLGFGAPDLDDPNDNAPATQEQIDNAGYMSKALKESLPILGQEVLGAKEGKRYAALKEQLSPLEDKVSGMKKLFAVAEKLGGEFQESFANAVAKNPDFSMYILKKLETTDSNLTQGLGGVDAEYGPYVAQIMDVVAKAGEEGASYDFKKLDGVLDNALTLQKQKTIRDNILKHSPHADVSEQDEEIQATTTALIHSAKDAGANVPAMADFNYSEFLEKLKNPEELDVFLDDFLKSNGLEGTQMGGVLRSMMQALAPMLGNFLNDIELGTTKIFGPLISSAGYRERGRMLQPTDVNDSAYVDNISRDDVADQYSEQMEGQPETIENAMQALEKVSPTSKEEIKLALKEVKNNPKFKAELEEVVAGGPESVANWHEHLVIGQSVKDATHDTATGKTALDVRDEQRAAQAEIERVVEAPSTVEPMTAANEAIFEKKVEGVLKTPDMSVNDQFKAVGKVLPEGMKDEWNALDKTKMHSIQEGLTEVFTHVGAEAANDPNYNHAAKVAERIADLQKGMAEGISPAVAVKGMASTLG